MPNIPAFQAINTKLAGATPRPLDSILQFSEDFIGSALNTTYWNTAVSTMTVTVSSGLNLNAASSVGTSVYALVKSYRTFSLSTGVLTADITATVTPSKYNGTIEMGFGFAATNAKPTDGAYFRFNDAGGLVAIVNNGGVEYFSEPIQHEALTDGRAHTYRVVIREDQLKVGEFFIDGRRVASLSQAPVREVNTLVLTGSAVAGSFTIGATNPITITTTASESLASITNKILFAGKAFNGLSWTTSSPVAGRIIFKADNGGALSTLTCPTNTSGLTLTWTKTVSGTDAYLGEVVAATSEPIFLRVSNSAIAPPTAPKLNVTDLVVYGAHVNKPWEHIIAGAGGNAYQGQTGNTLGQTANWTNSSAPSDIASGSLSNTTPSYATLGGLFSLGAPAGATTDYAIFGYQVPAGSATANGKTLYITGVRIDTYNAGATVATNPTFLQWGISAGSTTGDLSVSESATVKAARRIGLGSQMFAVGAVAGTGAVPIDAKFTSPLTVDAGCYATIILRIPSGAATGSEYYRGCVSIYGYFE